MIKAIVERKEEKGVNVEMSLKGYNDDLGLEALGLISTLMSELKAQSKTTYDAVIGTMAQVPEILAGEVGAEPISIRGKAN